MRMNSLDRTSSSAGIRTQGNQAFAEGNFGHAELLYSDALAVLSKEECEALTTRNYKLEKATLLSNRAQVKLNLGRPRDALEDCQIIELMELDKEWSKYWKVLLRKANALQELFQFQEALETLAQLKKYACLRSSSCPVGTFEIILRKEAELKRLSREYEPPELSAGDNVFSKGHMLRVSLLECSWNNISTLPAGVSEASAKMFIGNEFGLFCHDPVYGPLQLNYSIIGARGSPLPCGSAKISIREKETSRDESLVFSVHGRLQCAFRIELSKELVGTCVQLRFETQNKAIASVLSLPVLVISESPGSCLRSSWLERYGVEFSCCRELSFARRKGLTPIHMHLFEAAGQLGIAGKLWDSAAVLMHFIAQHDDVTQEFICGKQVLELGAGTGAVGIGCALVGAKNVITTDLECVVSQIQANIDLNWLGNSSSGQLGSIRAASLAWGETSLEECEIPCGVDTVVFADCIYEPDYYESLVTTLRALVHANSNCKILWAHRHRHPKDYEIFLCLEQFLETTLLQGDGPNFVALNEKTLATDVRQELQDFSRRFAKRASVRVACESDYNSGVPAQGVSVYSSQVRKH